MKNDFDSFVYKENELKQESQSIHLAAESILPEDDVSNSGDYEVLDECSEDGNCWYFTF